MDILIRAFCAATFGYFTSYFMAMLCGMTALDGQTLALFSASICGLLMLNISIQHDIILRNHNKNLSLPHEQRSNTTEAPEHLS